MVFLKSLAIGAVMSLLNGVALQLLWGWFLVPTLSLPAISLAQAIGICVIIELTTNQHIPRNERETIEMYIYCFLVPVYAVVTGWVVHLFV